MYSGGEVMKMMAFSIVKRLGEGSYMDDDLFIIERVRRNRAIKSLHELREKIRPGKRYFSKNGRGPNS